MLTKLKNVILGHKKTNLNKDVINYANSKDVVTILKIMGTVKNVILG
jgi:hypothetical protein